MGTVTVFELGERVFQYKLPSGNDQSIQLKKRKLQHQDIPGVLETRGA